MPTASPDKIFDIHINLEVPETFSFLPNRQTGEKYWKRRKNRRQRRMPLNLGSDRKPQRMQIYVPRGDYDTALLIRWVSK